jgi:hypothetical protein
MLWLEAKQKAVSWLLGIVVPLVFLFMSFPYLTGMQLRYRFRNLTPVEAIGKGLCDLGFAICLHGVFFRAYQEKPVIKWTLLALGIVAWMIGSLIKFAN